MNINPLSDVVIIRRAAPDRVSSSGLYLAWDSDYKEDIGEIVFVGEGKMHKCSKCKTDTRLPMSVRPGDLVLFSTNGHQITTIQGEELIILREASIIGIIGDKHGIESGTRTAERKYAGVER